MNGSTALATGFIRLAGMMLFVNGVRLVVVPFANVPVSGSKILILPESREIAVRHRSGRRPNVGGIEARSRVVDLLEGEEEEGLVLPVIDLGDGRGPTDTEAGTI